jgi:hypothetical protein
MKIIFVIISCLLTLVVNCQTIFNYSYINQSENKLLDNYGIDYTGPFIRYEVLSGEYKNINDTLLQKSFVESFDKFQKWNKGYFKTIPDTIYFSDGVEYMEDKLTNDLLKITFNETRKILGSYSIIVNDISNNIKTIEILELYNTGMVNYIDHVIMIQKFDLTWELFTYNDNDDSLDCPSCIVP